MRDGHRPSFVLIIWMSALLVALVVAPSAAAGDPLPKDELVKQGDAICNAIATKVNATNVRLIGSPFFSPQQIPKVVPHIAPLYASEVSRLGALQPAEAEASSMHSLTGLMTQRVTLMKKALAAARAKRWSAVAALHDRRVTLYHREQKIADAIGFVFCPTP